MDSNFHFGPARSGEQTVYGARTPDASLNSILEWANFIRCRGVTRVCCLLDDEQLAGFPVNLEAEYKKFFGAARILMERVADHHLCSEQALKGNILPFLRTADTDGERAVIHCWGGMAEPVTCSRLGSLRHEACPRWQQSRRWKQLDDCRGRLFLQATQHSTN